MVSIQVLATPISGLVRSSPVNPIALNMARDGARSRPSVIRRLRCFKSIGIKDYDRAGQSESRGHAEFERGFVLRRLHLWSPTCTCEYLCTETYLESKQLWLAHGHRKAPHAVSGAINAKESAGPGSPSIVVPDFKQLRRRFREFEYYRPTRSGSCSFHSNPSLSHQAP